MWKIKLKNIIPYLLYVIILLIIAYICNKIIQTLIFILFFNFIQNCFKYRFHSDTIIEDPLKAVNHCKLITISVEFVYIIYCKDLNVSIYANLFIIFLITFLNCILEFSLERIFVKQDCFKDKDTLLELCNQAGLSKNATQRMIMKYIENKTYQEIAKLEFTDIDTIKKSINRSRKKIFKNQN